MAEDITFSAERIQQAHAAAAAHAQDMTSLASNADAGLMLDGEFSVLAQCVSVTVEHGKICVNLPLHIGHQCLPIPAWIPSGTAGQVCLSICHTGPFPTGVKVVFSALGHVVVTKTFGKC